jgi:hypothetical protein
MRKNNNAIAALTALAIMLASSGAAAAYTLQPGDWLNVSGSDYLIDLLGNVTQYNQGNFYAACNTCPECAACNNTNTTQYIYINQSCGNSTGCGQCSIHANLLPGQNTTLNMSPCDINVTCNGAAYQNMRYPTLINIRKQNDTFLVSLSVQNYKNESYIDWSVPVGVRDLVDQTHEFDFVCPQEVITETNMQTCSKYLEPLLNESSPLIWQLSTGQSECTKTLVNSLGNMSAQTQMANQWEKDYLQKYNQWADCSSQLEQCNYNLNDPVNGACMQRVNNITQDYQKYKLATVGNGWMYLAIITWILLALYGANYLFRGGGF